MPSVIRLVHAVSFLPFRHGRRKAHRQISADQNLKLRPKVTPQKLARYSDLSNRVGFNEKPNTGWRATRSTWRKHHRHALYAIAPIHHQTITPGSVTRWHYLAHAVKAFNGFFGENLRVFFGFFKVLIIKG